MRSTCKESWFSLSKCKETEFSCNSGFCTNITNRCDNKYDCLDKSDEENCETIYSEKEIIIPPRSPKTCIKLITIVKIDNFDKINSYDSTLTITMSVNISWNDFRVTFKNLHSDIVAEKEILGMKLSS